MFFLCSPKERTKERAASDLFWDCHFFQLAAHYNSPEASGSNSNACAYPSLLSLKNATLFPKKIWWH